MKKFPWSIISFYFLVFILFFLIFALCLLKYPLLSPNQIQEIFFMYFIITKIIQAQSWGIIPVWVMIIGFLFWKL